MASNNKFERLIILAAMDCGKSDLDMFNQIDTSDVVFDNRFKRKKYKIIRNYKHRGRYTLTKKVIFKTLLILAILLSIVAMAVVASDAWRDSDYEVVVEEYSDHFLINFAPSGQSQQTTAEKTSEVVSEEINFEPSSENESEDISDETTEESTTITVKPSTPERVTRLPTWLPKDLEEVEGIKKPGMVVSDYFLGDDYYFTYVQHPIDEGGIHVDNEGATITNVFINGYSGILITYQGEMRLNLFWNDNDYLYYICGELITPEEAIKIAESVYD